jgi:alkaline phosphatase D
VDPQVHGPFSVRKAVAQRVYDEWMPIRLPSKGDPSRIYRALPFGDLVDLVVLDTRLEGRSQQLEGRQNDGELFSADPRAADPERQLYSPTQRAFVEQSLAGSRAAWKLVLNQVLVSQLKAQNLPDDASRALASLGQTGAPTEGVNLATDIWDGYEAERERLLGFLRENQVDDVVVLTGDIHVSMANDLTEDPFRVDVPPAAVEFVTTSVTSSNFDEIFGSPPRTTSLAIERALQAQNPSTRYLELDSNGWTLLDVTRERVQAEYLFVQTVAEPSDGQRLDATWQVRRGENRLVAGGPQTQDRADRPPAAPQPRVIATGPGPSGAGAAGRNPPEPAPPSALPATGGAATGPLALAALGLAALLGRRTRRPLEEQP